MPTEPGLFRLYSNSEAEVLRAHLQLGASRSGLCSRARSQASTGATGAPAKSTSCCTYRVSHKLSKSTRTPARIGNPGSDEPSSRADVQHVLGVALSAGDGCSLVRAHVWTRGCSTRASIRLRRYRGLLGTLSRYILAVETSLSSDTRINSGSGLGRCPNASPGLVIGPNGSPGPPVGSNCAQLGQPGHALGPVCGHPGA